MTEFVYLIGVRDGCHKIGRSQDPTKRAKQLSAKHKTPLAVVFTIPLKGAAQWDSGPHRLERYLHRAFSHRWAGGEWFRLTAGDIELVQSVAPNSTPDTLPPALKQLHDASLPPRISMPNARGRKGYRMPTTSVRVDCETARRLLGVAQSRGLTVGEVVAEFAAVAMRPPPALYPVGA